MQVHPEPSVSTAASSFTLPAAGYTVEKPEAVLITSQQQPPPPAYAPPSYQPPSTAYGFGPSSAAYPGQYSAPSEYGFAPATYGYPSGTIAPQPLLQNSQNVQVNVVSATASPVGGAAQATSYWPTSAWLYSTPMIIAQPASIALSPPSYLGWSIFNCLFCFWPLGLAAIVYSVKVGGARNYDEAKSHSITARNLNIAATTIAPILAIVVVGAVVGSVATGASYSPSSSYSTASSDYYSYGYYYYYTYLMYYTYYQSYSYTAYSSLSYSYYYYYYSYTATGYRAVTATKYALDYYYQYAQRLYYYTYYGYYGYYG